MYSIAIQEKNRGEHERLPRQAVRGVAGELVRAADAREDEHFQAGELDQSGAVREDGIGVEVLAGDDGELILPVGSVEFVAEIADELGQRANQTVEGLMGFVGDVNQAFDVGTESIALTMDHVGSWRLENDVFDGAGRSERGRMVRQHRSMLRRMRRADKVALSCVLLEDSATTKENRTSVVRNDLFRSVRWRRIRFVGRCRRASVRSVFDRHFTAMLRFVVVVACLLLVEIEALRRRHCSSTGFLFPDQIVRSSVVLYGESLAKAISVDNDRELLFNVTFRVDCVLKGDNVEHRIDIVHAGKLSVFLSCSLLISFFRGE